MIFHLRRSAIALVAGLACLAGGAAPRPAAAGEPLKIEIPAGARPAPMAVSGPRLKMNALVEGPVIRLGDVVEESGDIADAELAPSPAPGQRLALDAAEVAAFARSRGLDVPPVQVGRKVMVSRAARTVSREQIADQLADALTAQGIPPEKARHIEFAGRNPAFKLPVESQGGVLVENVDYDPDTGLFTAIVAAPGESATVEHVTLTGRLLDVTRVPVPRTNIAPGEIVGAADLDWVDLPSQRVARNIVSADAQIVGQAARRALRAGEPVLMGDLQRPQMVAKGALVTMVVSTPNLTLTATGKALDAGAEGDTVRLVNPSSNKTVHGIVTGPNEVRVGVGPRVASAEDAKVVPAALVR